MSASPPTQAFALLPLWILDAGVSHRALVLCLTLASYHAPPAIVRRRQLAAELSCSIASVDRALTELAEIRAIDIEPRIDPDNGGPGANCYRTRLVAS